MEKRTQRWPRIGKLPTLLAIGLVGGYAISCATEAEPVALGPVDGHDLAPTELDRVAVGDMAPDFSLETIEGDTLTLSSFQGAKNVVLVFYRGHW
jgi:hypothetical protein